MLSAIVFVMRYFTHFPEKFELIFVSPTIFSPPSRRPQGHTLWSNTPILRPEYLPRGLRMNGTSSLPSLYSTRLEQWRREIWREVCRVEATSQEVLQEEMNAALLSWQKEEPFLRRAKCCIEREALLEENPDVRIWWRQNLAVFEFWRGEDLATLCKMFYTSSAELVLLLRSKICGGQALADGP